MRKFLSVGPSIAVLLVCTVALLATPAAIRNIRLAQASATITLAQQRLDGEDLLERLNEAGAAVADSVEPSVVHVEAWESGAFRPYSTGAGWVYDAGGHIITNAHVVRGADRLRVQFWDGHIEDAELVGIDAFTDIAVASVGPDPSVIPARRASGQAVRAGHRVYAFGSPFGFKFSMTEGIVSGLGREASGVTGRFGYTNFIQTDAAVNPGNSGGPLVDIRGRVVGMNTAIVTSDNPNGSTETRNQSAGIGFAIPLETIESVAGQLIERGTVLRGFLGIRLSEVQTTSGGPPGFRGSGILVEGTEDNQPGARAGLQSGDIITHLNGERTPTAAVLRSRISSARPGAIARLTVWREGQTMEIDARLGAAHLTMRNGMQPVDPDTFVASDADARRANDVAESMARYGIASLTPGEGGVRIVMIHPRSRAEEQGLRAGQTIIAVNGEAVSAPEELFDILGRSSNRDRPTIDVRTEAGDVESKELTLRR